MRVDPELREVGGYLRSHSLLNRYFEEDSAFTVKERMKIGAPTAFDPIFFSGLLLETIRATGVRRKAGQDIAAYARSALKDRTIGIIGTRYGLLQKIFEIFGAKTYGMDTDSAAVRVANQRGLTAVAASAEDIDRHFPGRKPDFLVSFYFFAKHYWENREEQLEGIIRALHKHSSKQTIHLHQTIGAPVPLENFTSVSQTGYSSGLVSVFKKKE